MRKAAFLISAMAASATAALSQSPTTTTKRGPSNDPNEIVCVKEAEIGSRLAHRRICRTRAEWEEHHRQLRQAIDKAQADKQTNSG